MKRSSIRRVSKKKQKQDVIYKKLRLEFLEENPICMICRGAKATEISHRRGRGIYYLEVKTWDAACNTCGQRVTNNPKWAMENGYSEDRIGHK